MDHQDHMNSGQLGDSQHSPANNIASGVANMTISGGHQQDMKNGTAAHMGPGDGPVKGLYIEYKNVVTVIKRGKKCKAETPLFPTKRRKAE